MHRFASIAGVLAALTLALAIPAAATAPPVGALPPGQVTTVTASKSTLVSVVLPKGAHGRSWRQARSIDTSVLREVTEANVGSTVVIVFKAVGRGTTKVVYGLTRGETKKAYASITYSVTVR
jgi:hypothetical protein